MNVENLRQSIRNVVEDETGDMFPVILHETDLIDTLTEFVRLLVEIEKSK